MSEDDELTPAQQRIIDACHRPLGKPFSYETHGRSREAILAWVRGEQQAGPDAQVKTPGAGVAPRAQGD